MKRWKTMVSIFMILFMFTGIAYGTSNKLIDVTINGKNVSVTQVSIIKDGQVIDVGLPSFVYVDRTLVPVRLAEKLGAKVGWDQKTKTATVSHNGKEIKLTIDSDKATIGNETKKLDKNSTPRLVVFSDKDARTMIPFSFMAEMLGYEVGWDGKAKAASINTKKQEKPEVGVDTKPVDKPVVDLSNKVMKVTNEKVDGQEAIVIHGTKDIKHKIIKLKNPERIVVDLLDSTLQGSTFYEFDYELGFIKGVRVSQFVPDKNYNADDKIVRLVLDTKDGSLNPDVKVEQHKNKIVIFPEKNFWENMNYYVDGMSRTLTINNDIKTNYSVDYDSANKCMEITIPKNAVDLTEGSSSIRDNLVDSIKIVEDSSDMKVILQFTKNIEYNLLSNDIDNKVVLQIKGKSNQKPGERVIVIDPGHGGAQPGSISPNGVKEKDINLEISLKVERELRNAGYNIIMTRDEDSTLGLSERPAIANENFADLFISIHGNSFTNSAVNGIEVWYVTAASDSEKEKGQVKLAKDVLDEMIKETGANNRGVKKSSGLVVLKQSKMPAILIEVGFLSNAEEEKLIIDDNYQDRIVKGIVSGVKKYFDRY